MNIEEQFNLIAKEYDDGRKKFISCFDDYYGKTTDFLANCIPAPRRVLDLGTGTGLLTLFWYRKFPKAEYVLTDIADEMLNVAKKRFEGLENILFETLDYRKGLPEKEFDLIISALSIHHLDNTEKARLFNRIYEKLPKNGIFINYDQFCGNSREMTKLYDSYWENQIKSGGISESDFALWKERRKLDRECSVSDEIKMLLESNFKTAECVFSNRKFSVIFAVKRQNTQLK